MSEINSPAIRFAGFTDAWEQRKLVDIIDDYVERTTIQNQYPVLTSSQQWGIIFQEDYFAGRQATTVDNIGYFVLPRGYFTYRSRSDNNIFVFNRNDLINKGIISYFYPVFRLKDTDSDFFLQRVNNGIQRQITMSAEGTGQHVLSLKKFKNIESLFPAIDEQAQIGAVFNHLDGLITLHQREHDKTVNIKKALLEKMFPKAGEDKPEIRFAGFTDAWEQRKLGEIASFSKGQGYSKGDLQEEGTPIILYGRLYTKYETVISSVDTFVHAKENSVYSRGNEVIVPASGETAEDIARAAVVEDAGVLLGGDLNILHPHPIIDSAFLALTISNGERQKDLSKRAQGKSVVHIHNSDLQEVILAYPSLDEQKKIGPLFRNFDRLIALHQRELTKLQNIKKALLEKMFV